MTDPQIYLITNDPSELKQAILQDIYQSTATNQLAYGDVKDQETGEIFPAILGLEFNDEGGIAGAVVIGRLFLATELMDRTYLLANGRGDYIDPDEVPETEPEVPNEETSEVTEET